MCACVSSLSAVDLFRFNCLLLCVKVMIPVIMMARDMKFGMQRLV